jgi:hypothetical protein
MGAFDRKEVLLRYIKNDLEELGVDEKVFEFVKTTSLDCESPRRDGTPCYWCKSCYDRWTAERKAGIEHDKAVDCMMIMFEDKGRE